VVLNGVTLYLFHNLIIKSQFNFLDYFFKYPLRIERDDGTSSEDNITEDVVYWNKEAINEWIPPICDKALSISFFSCYLILLPTNNYHELGQTFSHMLRQVSLHLMSSVSVAGKILM